ncbi:MAG: hypothetical protein ABIS29_03670 [Vicinamibacterales bacterium]
MSLRRPGFYIILLVALSAELVSTQAHRAGDGFVAVRAGANLVGNTYRVRERKPEPGAGGSIGTFLSPLWALEFETWMRASNPECCGPRQREMLYSASVVRLLTSQGLQPYMLGGLTFLQTDNPELQVQVGVGAQFPLYHRLQMAIDLRGNGGGSTMIVRPTAAIIYNFR